MVLSSEVGHTDQIKLSLHASLVTINVWMIWDITVANYKQAKNRELLINWLAVPSHPVPVIGFDLWTCYPLSICVESFLACVSFLLTCVDTLLSDEFQLSPLGWDPI